MRRLAQDDCIIGKVPALNDDQVYFYFNFNNYRLIDYLMSGTQTKIIKYHGLS